MGAALAAEFTAQNPDKVAVLVLEEVPWFDPASPPEIPQQALAANNPAAIKKLIGVESSGSLILQPRTSSELE